MHNVKLYFQDSFFFFFKLKKNNFFLKKKTSAKLGFALFFNKNFVMIELPH